MQRKKISVLYFSNAVARGGAEEHVLTLLRRLDRGCFQPFLACTPGVAAMLRPDLPLDVEVLEVCLRRPYQFWAGLRLAQFIRRHKIDIVHSHLFYSSVFGSTIGWLCRVPVIVETPHVRECWRRGWKASYRIDRLVSRYIDRYIAVSKANAHYLIGEKGLPVSKVSVIRNGIDLKKFVPSVSSPELRDRLGFGDTGPVLLVVGRLEPQKGHAVLISALPKIRQAFPSVRLVCVGGGSLQPELQQQAVHLDVQDAIYWAGFQSNVQDWLALADVAVLPSFYEGLPISAMESLAAARPIVATAVDGTPEIVVHEQNGLLVRPGDPDALANEICRLLADPDLRRRMGAFGRSAALQNFDQDRQVQSTAQLYFTLLCERGRVSLDAAVDSSSSGAFVSDRPSRNHAVPLRRAICR